MVGPSGSGKSCLIHDWLIIGTFQPDLDKLLFLSTASVTLLTNVQKHQKH